MAIRYDEDEALGICDRIAAGETLDAICADAHMPSAATVRRWAIDDRDGFAARYQRARQLQALHYADQIITLADTPSVCVRRTVVVDDEGKETIHEVRLDQTDRTRLQIDARKWHCAKVLPKVYGEKIDHQHAHTMSLTQLVEASMKPKEAAEAAAIAGGIAAAAAERRGTGEASA